MKEFDLIIKNGTVVTSTESFLCDVAVKDGKIAAMAQNIEADAKEIYDEMYLYRITKISQNSKSYDSANFAVPCIQICPLKRRPTFGSPIRSFWAIPTWKSISLQLIVRS